jgi:hypothetical protein
MLTRVKSEFPELFTKKDETLKKNAPKRFKCECGNEFNKTKSLHFCGIGFAIPACEKCDRKAKESRSFIIWTRMVHNQIEHEDFILDLVQKHTTIVKDDLESALNKQFKDRYSKALSHLVYFGYLNVDPYKRDELGIIEYFINTSKDLNNRYERIS